MQLGAKKRCKKSSNPKGQVIGGREDKDSCSGADLDCSGGQRSLHRGVSQGNKSHKFIRCCSGKGL